jgi:sugar diacid utilization regulator
MRRARAGFALEDYVSAYRVGTRVMWDAIGEVAEGDSVDYRTVLALAASVMRSNHFATTHAGEAYVEFRQHGLADVAKERRDLLERLLEGALPESGALAAAAERYGLGAAVPVLVAVALPLGAGSDPDASLLASATLARAGLQDPASLVVVRHAEIVSIFGLAAGRDPDQVCVRLEQAQQRIRREGTSLAIGVSTIAKGIAELPNAYREAVAAVRFVGKEGGVAALTRLTQFEYLALNADATTRRLIDPRVQAFLDDDNRRGGALVATIRAYAEADLSLKRAGALLHVHTNTARYRLDRIEELTGLNPRRFKDLQALLVAIAVNDA